MVIDGPPEHPIDGGQLPLASHEPHDDRLAPGAEEFASGGASTVDAIELDNRVDQLDSMARG